MTWTYAITCVECGRETTQRETEINNGVCHACAVAEERGRQVAEAERAEAIRRERDFEDNGPRGNNQ